MFTAGHLVAGIFLGEIILFLTNLNPIWALIAIGIGSIVPNLDMLLHHRKTFHSPKIAPAAFVILFIIYLPTGVGGIGYLSLFLLGVGAHSIIDIFGSGKELRPWEQMDNRAVYDHVEKKFMEPRRLYYDGSIEDIGFTTAVSLVLMVIRPALIPLLVICIAGTIGFHYAQRIVAMRTQKFDRWSQLIKYQVFGGDPSRYD